MADNGETRTDEEVLKLRYLVADSRSVHENSAAISRMLVWSMVSFILTLVSGHCSYVSSCRFSQEEELIVLVDRNGPRGCAVQAAS